MRPDSAPHPNRWRRLAEAAVAVAAWTGLGSALGTDPNGYLLLGVPITAGFQLWVHRRPLHTLWVRDAPAFRLDRSGLLLAAMLAATPMYALARLVARRPSDPDWTLVAWVLAAIAGAVGAAFGLRSFGRSTIRDLVACLATAGILGAALNSAARLARSDDPVLIPWAVVEGVRWFLLYLPVAFLLEEVFFRGALDAHVHRRGESRGGATAVFVSALWGLWHLPVAPLRDSIWVMAAGLVTVHVIVGVPLSLYWRRSGNLAVPATAHAFVNGVRNALLQS